MFRQLSRPVNATASVKQNGAPFMASHKFDGVRFSYQDGEVYSRSGKLIPNEFIRNQIKSANLPDGLDGELIVGKNFQETTSAVMSRDGEPDFQAIVFDILPGKTDPGNFKRFCDLKDMFPERYYLDTEGPVYHTNITWLKLAADGFVYTPEGINDYFKKAIEAGYEGIVLRPLNGKYYDKMFKMKDEKSDEAFIVGFTQLVRKDGTPAEQVGAITVQREIGGPTFNIGTGLKTEDRIVMWARKEEYYGKIVNYRYDYLSTNKIPRFPRFAGIRNKIDLV